MSVMVFSTINWIESEKKKKKKKNEASLLGHESLKDQLRESG